MSSNSFLYPHPILGHTDDILVELGEDCVDAVVATTDYCHNYRFVLKIEDPTILNLIANNKAKYAVNIKCRSSLYQDRVISTSNELIVKIPRTYALGRVDFEIFVIATEPFTYHNPKANPAFKDCSFEINPGDPLVFFPPKWDNLDITYHTLKHYSSILVPVPNDELQDNDILVVTNDKIEVNLSRNTFNLFKEVNKEKNSPELISSIVQTALTTALLKLFTGSIDDIEEIDDIQKCEIAWVEAIVLRMQNEEGMPSLDQVFDNPFDEVPSLVQKLLQYPIGTLLEKLQNSENSAEHADAENNDF
ncbi:MAG: hypothetical protein Q4A08_03135 [Bacteroidales bacterium]|nr:hypothetical protein [Bacteroidales bacterium]